MSEQQLSIIDKAIQDVLLEYSSDEVYGSREEMESLAESNAWADIKNFLVTCISQERDMLEICSPEELPSRQGFCKAMKVLVEIPAIMLETMGEEPRVEEMEEEDAGDE